MFGVLASPAGASTLTSTDGNTSLNTTGSLPITPGTPYTSGQSIQVQVQANGVMDTTNLAGAGAPTGGLFYVEECTDPGGLAGNLPTGPTNCEVGTLSTGASKSSDGSLTLTGNKAFIVYDLPDPGSLGGSPSMTGQCDVAPNQCVLGIFASNPNGSAGGAAFTYPHLFSAPFQVSVGDGADAGNNPGDGTPEVPLAIGLPLAAAAVIGGSIFYSRRRRQRTA